MRSILSLQMLAMASMGDQEIQTELGTATTGDLRLQNESVTTASTDLESQTEESWETIIDKKWDSIKESWSSIAEVFKSESDKADEGVYTELDTSTTNEQGVQIKESWVKFEKFLDQNWDSIKEMSVWSSIAQSTGSAWNSSMQELDELVDYIKNTNDKKIIQAACATAGGVTGAFTPAAFYSAMGLSSIGPVSGGLFASAQAAGMVVEGSLLAGIQSAAMVGPLAPVILGTGALGATAYFICRSFTLDKEPFQVDTPAKVVADSKAAQCTILESYFDAMVKADAAQTKIDAAKKGLGDAGCGAEALVGSLAAVAVAIYVITY